MRVTGFMRRFAVFTFCAALLGACTPPETYIACPNILIPLGTDRVTRFAPGEGRDITDIIVQAEVKFLSGECTIREEAIEMTFPVAIGGLRGAADRDGTETINLFLAVATQNRDILTRRELPMTLIFDGNRTSSVSSDTVTITIPKRPDQLAKEFVLFLGIVLTEDELEYNRQESRR